MHLPFVALSHYILTSYFSSVLCCTSFMNSFHFIEMPTFLTTEANKILSCEFNLLWMRQFESGFLLLSNTNLHVCYWYPIWSAWYFCILLLNCVVKLYSRSISHCMQNEQQFHGILDEPPLFYKHDFPVCYFFPYRFICFVW